MVKVLTKRIGHLGFEFSNGLAQGFVLHFNCVAKYVKPFVLTAVTKTVCNAWPTSRRYGHNNVSHCRLGCFAVAGDDLRHYPFCPVVEGFIRSEGGIVCLWFRNRSLGHPLLLHPVNFDAMSSLLSGPILFFKLPTLLGVPLPLGGELICCSLGAGLYLLGSLSLIELWWVTHSAIESP